MLINAGSLVGTTAVTSILGIAYWWIAARRFPPEAVGIASASISAMTLLGGFSILGLGTLLITELPRQPDRAGSLISTALIVAGGVGGCVGIMFAVFASYVSPSFNPLGANILDVVIFASGVSLTAISLVLDPALIGLLRGELQFWRNTLVAVTKLVALFIVSLWISGEGSITIYTTWAIGNALSLMALAAFFAFKEGWPGRKFLPQWVLLRKLGFAALQHHLLNLTLQSPVLILPVLVTALLSSTMNAWFYVAWMIANFVFFIPNALTIVLHAMNSAQQSTLARKARVTMSFGLVIIVAANCLLLFATKQVLSVFGKVYADQALWTLRILVLAAFPLIIKYHYISICRIQDRIARAMLGMLPGGILELGAAALGAHLGGLTGLSVGWVVAIYVEAMFMIHTVYKTILSSKTSALSTRQHPGTEAVSLVETSPLPTVGQTYKVVEAIWHMKTPLMSDVKPPAIREPDTGKKFVQQYENRYVRASRHRLKPPRLQPYTPHDSDTYITDTGVGCQFLEGSFDNGTIVEDEMV